MKRNYTLGISLLFSAIAISSEASALTASDIYVGSTAASGVRPLVTIMVDFSDANFPSAQQHAYYRQLLFGSDGVVPLQPNVAGLGGYFHYASNWTFRFRNAGIVGPFRALNDAATTGDESTFACLIGGDDSKGACRSGPADDPGAFIHLGNALVAASAQVRFGDFDTNNDGTITQNELAVLLIEAVPTSDWYGGGAARGSYPRTITLNAGLSPGLKLNLNAALVRHHGDVETIIHELTHVLGIGTPEPYGADSVNLNVGMMSAVTKVADGRSTVLYDPYIRMKLGWLNPSFMTTTTGTDVNIVAAADSYGKDERAVVLYDAAHGNREFFVLEYRTKMNRRILSSNMVELHNLWSPDDTNYAMTSDTAFDGVPGMTFSLYGKPYQYKRSEGWASSQQQTGTSPILAWRSPSLRDDQATLLYLPSQTVTPDYQFGSVIGYVFTASGSNMMPLNRWWNPVTSDYHTTSDPSWAGQQGAKKGDYTLISPELRVQWSPDLNYDADPWGAGHTRLPNEGLAIWHVRLNPTNQYFQEMPSQPVPATDIPLTRWWSAQRGDNFDTDSWPAQKAMPTQDYVYGGEIGRLYAAPGTDRAKMWLWYSDTRNDNFSTTDPAWAGTTPGQTRLGYRYVGLVGYVTTTPIGDSKVPLYSYWSAERGDNMLSTATSVSGYVRVRTEGYIRPAKNDAGLYIVPPGGAPEGHPGTNALWTSAHGTATLKWFDGTTACTVRVTSASTVARTLAVRVN